MILNRGEDMVKAKTLNNKKKILIISICSAVLLAAIIAVVIIIINNSNKKLDDSYFVSDGSKYVLSVNYSDIIEETDDEDNPYIPSKFYEVYTYSGNDITGLKHYYEYEDEELAKNAFNVIREENPNEDGVSIDGRYIILVADESEYEGSTASDIKETIELYEEFKKNGKLDEE